MDINQTYQDIISNLKKDERGLIKFNKKQVQELITSWNSNDLKKILCILDHLVDYDLAFAPKIINELQKDIDFDKLIFLLGPAQKHIISAAAQNGYPPDGKFLMIIKDLLNSKHGENPETFEWLLRTIEQTGMKSILFKEAILKRKPGLGVYFNQHKKACKEIIELLERRWAPIAGGPLGQG